MNILLALIGLPLQINDDEKFKIPEVVINDFITTLTKGTIRKIL